MTQDRNRNPRGGHTYGNGRERRSLPRAGNEPTRGRNNAPRNDRRMNQSSRRDLRAPGGNARANHQPERGEQRVRREQAATRRVQRDAINREVRRKPERRIPGANAGRRTAAKMSAEAEVRRKVKTVYLALIACSLVIIIVFAVLLKGKLKTVKEVPTNPNVHYQFEEHPRLTLPPMESFLEGEDPEEGFEDDGESAEDDGDVADDEGEQSTDAEQP
ncbi:MAG TPA: hypothetical protein GX728_04810 [Clostridiaceae bacterium]|nr:hypothetical protein [Clostridiaceae bacterium]